MNEESLPKGPYLILDANSLLSPFQFGYNIDDELRKVVPGFDPAVPSCVLRELESLSRKGDWKFKAALRLAGNYKEIPVKGRGDGPIFNLALGTGWPVMTQDKTLKNKLLKRGIRVVVLRNGRYLQLIEP